METAGKTLIDNLDPIKGKIRVTAIRETVTGKIVIKSDNADSTNKVAQNIALRG